ncbi:hypothetical protein ACOI1C_17525, partial [Bacillus sp. DJP31]|uniref:hypothetical protein n=1 Tax=Bacillus sp. DJP31 TaxID=3409789 RepID=UPI003BB59370
RQSFFAIAKIAFNSSLTLVKKLHHYLALANIIMFVTFLTRTRKSESRLTFCLVFKELVFMPLGKRNLNVSLQLGSTNFLRRSEATLLI